MISSGNPCPNPSPSAQSSNNQYSIPVLSKVEGVDNQLHCPSPLSHTLPHTQTELSLNPLLSIYCRWDIANTSTISPQSIFSPVLPVSIKTERSLPNGLSRRSVSEDGSEAPWLRPPHLSIYPPSDSASNNHLSSISCRWDIANTSTINPLLSTVPMSNVHEIRHLSRTFDKLNFFMQNEPNLNIWIIVLNPFLLTTNADFAAPNVNKNKAKQTQNEPISNPFSKAKIPSKNKAVSYNWGLWRGVCVKYILAILFAMPMLL